MAASTRSLCKVALALGLLLVAAGIAAVATWPRSPGKGQALGFPLDDLLAEEGFRGNLSGKGALQLYCEWAEGDAQLRGRLVEIAMDPAVARDIRMSAAGILVHIDQQEAAADIAAKLAPWVNGAGAEHDRVRSYLAGKLPLAVLQSDLPPPEMLEMLKALRPNDWMEGIRLWASDLTYEDRGEDSIFSREEVGRRRTNAQALVRYIESSGPALSGAEETNARDSATLQQGGQSDD